MRFFEVLLDASRRAGLLSTSVLCFHRRSCCKVSAAKMAQEGPKKEERRKGGREEERGEKRRQGGGRIGGVYWGMGTMLLFTAAQAWGRAGGGGSLASGFPLHAGCSLGSVGMERHKGRARFIPLPGEGG